MAVDFRFTEAQVRRRMEFRKFALEEIAPPAFKTDLWHRFPPGEYCQDGRKRLYGIADTRRMGRKRS